MRTDKHYRVLLAAALLLIVGGALFRCLAATDAETSVPGQAKFVIPSYAKTEEIEESKAVIEGNVVSEDGVPVKSAAVCSEAIEGGAIVECVKGDEDGAFALSVFAPARYRLRVVAPDFFLRHQASTPDVLVVPGQIVSGLKIVVGVGGTPISGVVRDIYGGVIEYARIECVYPLGSGCFALTDSDGRFRARVATARKMALLTHSWA